MILFFSFFFFQIDTEYHNQKVQELNDKIDNLTAQLDEKDKFYEELLQEKTNEIEGLNERLHQMTVQANKKAKVLERKLNEIERMKNKVSELF